MVFYAVGDLRTGRFTTIIPEAMVMQAPWDDRILTPASLSITVDLNDKDVRALGLRNTATPAKAFLARIDGSHVIAGPVWTHSWKGDTRILDVGAKGLESYWEHRHILPLLAASLPVEQWTIPAPEDPEAAIPNPALTSTFTKLALGTIAKRLVQQAHEWTGGDLPVVFLPDEAGDHERNYLAVDFKTIGGALDDLANVDGGPEYRFRARLTADQMGIEWVFETGTRAQPLLVADREHLWDLSVPETVAFGLDIDNDASDLASLSWATGGRENDTVLISRQSDSTLIDAGFPLLETVDTSHSSVSQQPTLDAHARANLTTRPYERWSLVVKAHPVDKDGKQAGPQLGDFTTGDYACVTVAPWDEDKGIGDPYLIEGGTFEHRIVGLSGDVGQNVTVQLQTRLE